MPAGTMERQKRELGKTGHGVCFVYALSKLITLHHIVPSQQNRRGLLTSCRFATPWRSTAPELKKVFRRAAGCKLPLAQMRRTMSSSFESRFRSLFPLAVDWLCSLEHFETASCAASFSQCGPYCTIHKALTCGRTVES